MTKLLSLFLLLTFISIPTAYAQTPSMEKKAGGTDHMTHMKHMEEVRQWLKKELGDKYDKPLSPATPDKLEKGKKIYQANCAACHGTTGKGDGPAAAGLPDKPADFTDQAHSSFYSDRGRIHIIKKGVTGTLMVGWEKSLSEEEIQAVYYYIRFLRSNEKTQGSSEQKHDHAH